MSRILIIGGYGGFGGRLSRRFARAGHRVLVAGRNAARAQRFCEALAGTEPVVLDRDSDVSVTLSQLGADLVVDAAGPFQRSGYRLPEACISAGIPYLDLADARDFVSGIAALDERARRAGVAIVAGASTAPGLTSAAVGELAAGLEPVHSVDIALSAANRPTGGEAVVAAVLSYVGRPIRLWRGGRWTHGYGLQEMRREDFLFADGSGLRGRLVALADLPDCELLPQLVPGHPAVAFRVGTESRLQMFALWLASWSVRCGIVSTLSGALQWLIPLYHLTSRSGGERSAMNVVVTGRRDGRAVERRWTIVAERGEGLEIPTLTAELLAADLLAGRLPAGARSAASLLPFDRYEPALSALAVRHETAERVLPPPLYARVMGSAFERLPPAVRRLHTFSGDAWARGEGKVARGGGFIAHALARLMGMAPAGAWPLHVAFSERRGVEIWTRDFGGHVFASELRARGSLVVERFGPLRFAFALPSGSEGLEMRLSGWSAFGIPMPRRMAPRIAAREWEKDGKFHFEVEVLLPWGGPIVGYSGWLAPGQGYEEGAAPAGTAPLEPAEAAA